MPALRVYTAYFIMLIWADKPLRGICFSLFPGFSLSAGETAASRR
jgi:hypothetical protein